MKHSGFFANLIVVLICYVSTIGHAGTGYCDTIPGYPDVIGEYVQIPGAKAPGTPDAFNTATFLRVRSAKGGNSPQPAHAVIIAQPGWASTPGIWMNLSAQLVQKASNKICRKNIFCQVEVWIMDRRGSQLEDTAGLRTARKNQDPKAALDYYFGSSVLTMDKNRPTKFPIAPADSLLGREDSTFHPLKPDDVPFMAEWGFETIAGDIDALMMLFPKSNRSKNIFLAGHSQGGGFVSLYGGRRLPDKSRGFKNLAGLIFLDGGPAIGKTPSPSAKQLEEYFSGVDAFRKGKAPVFGTMVGATVIGPGSGALSAVKGLYSIATPDVESIFAPSVVGGLETSPAGDAFLSALRHTYRANAAMTFDTDPLPGAGLQSAILSRLGASMGRLDFKPVAGTEKICDPATPEDAEVCPPSIRQINSYRLYGWREGGGKGPEKEPSTSQSYINASGWGPSRTNVKPITHTFPVSGTQTIDAGEMNHLTWYQSQRYDTDMGFFGEFQRVDISANDVNVDIDRKAINIPVYVAHQEKFPNPFPRVKDFTEISSSGVTQTKTAKKRSPIDPKANTSLYNHSDFMMAEDHLSGKVAPGEPGASVVADTLLDWMMARAKGRIPVPQPEDLGVVKQR